MLWQCARLGSRTACWKEFRRATAAIRFSGASPMRPLRWGICGGARLWRTTTGTACIRQRSFAPLPRRRPRRIRFIPKNFIAAGRTWARTACTSASGHPPRRRKRCCRYWFLSTGARFEADIIMRLPLTERPFADRASSLSRWIIAWVRWDIWRTPSSPRKRRTTVPAIGGCWIRSPL